ncbi:IPT/TIG domain-containing protein [Herbiconiux solani]|uniref:IPT/TIG domain-containing protein n=1 Tax=Herbiconiux solani TaxID=661329 RepID=UPI0008257B6B|nr:IPT/TIG domain-containing protein [Herbiconiux solani]
MNTRVKNRVIAGLVAAGLVGGSSLLVAGPANADPGDASAIGAAGVFTFHFGKVFNYEQSNALGVLGVSNPGQDETSLNNQTLLQIPFASLTLANVTSAVQSDDTAARAFSSVATTSANLFGLSLVSLDSATAAAQCEVGGDPAAAVDVAGLRILGIPVTLDENTPAVSQSANFPAAVGTGNGAETVDLSGVKVTVNVAQIQEATDDLAVGISLAVQVVVEGSFTDTDATVVTLPPATVATNLILASASCETPAVAPVTPLTATGITPAHGTSAGGQTVTVTGTGFVPGTTVSFAGVPATNVVVAEDGTSLTAVTPAGTAGSTAAVLLTNPNGTTATLGYAYDAIVPVTPVTPIIPAGTGGTTLAATGTDPAPLAAGAAGVLGLGLLLAAAARLRRRAL